MPDGFNLSSTETIIRSPALNAPSSQSALPRRRDSWSSRSRMRSSTMGSRSARQGLSLSRSFTVTRSRIGGSTVLSAANIHVIARARIGFGRKQARTALGDMEHDGPGLEQHEIAFLVGRD